jgi:uncharacterized membrane protein
MFRSDRRMIAASAAVSLAMAAIAQLASVRLPAGTRLPVHWNVDGQADRFADAGTALFLPVALVVGMSLVFAVIPRLEPLQHRLEGSRPLYVTAWTGLLCVMAVVQAMVAAPAFGLTLPPQLPMVGAGGFLLLLGNALPKSRPGFFVGIRTPWTIIDTDNWIATHRLGGRVMMLAGAIVIAAALLPLASVVRAMLVIAAIGAAVAVPTGYSWWHWRRTTAG